MAMARGRPGPPKSKAAVAKPVPYHLKPKEAKEAEAEVRNQRPKSPKLSSRPGSAAIDAADL